MRVPVIDRFNRTIILIQNNPAGGVGGYRQGQGLLRLKGSPVGLDGIDRKGSAAALRAVFPVPGNLGLVQIFPRQNPAHHFSPGFESRQIKLSGLGLVILVHDDQSQFPPGKTAGVNF